MKKVYIILIFFLLMLVTGCEINDEQYKEFEHYTLEQKEIRTQTFYEEGKKTEYALADISEEKKNTEGGVEGLFYKVSENDYILLDEIEACGDISSKLYLSEQYTYFYKNEETKEEKLYIVRCLGAKLLEYTLNKEKYEKRKLEFDTKAISDDPLKYVEFDSIQKVSGNDIYIMKGKFIILINEDSVLNVL